MFHINKLFLLLYIHIITHIFIHIMAHFFFFFKLYDESFSLQRIGAKVCEVNFFLLLTSHGYGAFVISWWSTHIRFFFKNLVYYKFRIEETYLWIGLLLKSAICSDLRLLILSGMSGMSETKKQTQNCRKKLKTYSLNIKYQYLGYKNIINTPLNVSISEPFSDVGNVYIS